MAIWQFDFYLSPQKRINKKYDYLPENISTDEIDDLIDWTQYSVSELSIDKISKILPPTKSWTEDIKQFGKIEETCVKLLYNANVLEEISIRIDLRSVTTELLKTIIQFVAENNAIIITDTGKLLVPSIDLIINEIRKSKAFSFVENPEKFIKDCTKVDTIT